MDYVNLGRSGLKVSRLGLGCMSYGVQAREWRTDEATGCAFIGQALALGINLFDTADMYGGESEDVLGRALPAASSHRPGVAGRVKQRCALFKHLLVRRRGGTGTP